MVILSHKNMEKYILTELQMIHLGKCLSSAGLEKLIRFFPNSGGFPCFLMRPEGFPDWQTYKELHIVDVANGQVGAVHLGCHW